MKPYISRSVMGAIAVAASCFVLSRSLGAQSRPNWNVPKAAKIPVAFVVSDDAVVIDFAGPWEVFEDVMVPSRGPNMADQHVFQLYTVSHSKKPIRVSGGLQVVPDYTFDDAPIPRIVVIPAQRGDSGRMLSWIREMTRKSDVVMSVCTGAFVLAETGVLNGKAATTHHDAVEILQQRFPEVRVQRGMRWVESGPGLFTSGGLSAGIDLALHVVDRNLGRDIARATARSMEYQGTDWMGNGTASSIDSTRVTNGPARR